MPSYKCCLPCRPGSIGRQWLSTAPGPGLCSSDDASRISAYVDKTRAPSVDSLAEWGLELIQDFITPAEEYALTRHFHARVQALP